MPKKFSESLKLPDSLRNDRVGQRLYVLNAQARKHLEQTPERECALQILEEAIAKLDATIEMPPTRRIRLNSRQFSDFPLESADRREMIRLKTNQDIEVGSKWLPLLETKLALYAEQPAPAVTLHYLD